MGLPLEEGWQFNVHGLAGTAVTRYCVMEVCRCFLLVDSKFILKLCEQVKRILPLVTGSVCVGRSTPPGVGL